MSSRVRHVNQSLYGTHRIGIFENICVVGAKTRPKAGSLIILHCVTSTVKKKVQNNYVTLHSNLKGKIRQVFCLLMNLLMSLLKLTHLLEVRSNELLSE